ncbi:ribosomal-protein-alanine acetyltransferase [Streptomyces sp. SPB78]|uniref:GNAT family N-acetyltransferase n=1 Tax=Streptomyces sp. (strain SPB78) TaxID=591157 RepID=UPI0001B5385F|nr:N-acetyltransferase [Streptomyces sp. SPB78]EFK99335.1 ribosomal-protein-alanine acetyltransferase [Streptomyces sp. SPB78]
MPTEQPIAASARPPAPGAPLVRPARAGDESALAALDAATWSTLHAITPRPVPPLPSFFRPERGPEAHLVAEVPENPGHPVGYLRLVPSIPLPANAHVRAIQGLAVDPAVRGRGVARALLRAAVARCRAEGARRLTLRVLGHNAPARRLYESEGFAVEGVLPGEMYLDGAYVDDVLMGLVVHPEE